MLSCTVCIYTSRCLIHADREPLERGPGYISEAAHFAKGGFGEVWKATRHSSSEGDCSAICRLVSMPFCPCVLPLRTRSLDASEDFCKSVLPKHSVSYAQLQVSHLREARNAMC